MSSESTDHRTKAQLLEEIEQLRWRLEEAEQTVEAIRHGDVDALVVTSPQGEQVFSITGAEHIYRVIVETMNEAAVTVDQDGTILFCNQRFCDLVKTPLHEVIGRKVTVFAARPQQRSLRAMLADAQAEAVQRRVTLRAADDTQVPVQISASPLQIDGTASICLVASDLRELEASANSIRVLREHQQAVQESESGFRAIFESSRDAVVIADDDGVYVQANPAVQAVFGLSAEQLLGRRVSDFVREPTDFPTIWQSFLVTGMFHGEMPLTGADGQVRYIEVDAVANILPHRHLSVIRDITERKLAREALETANEQLLIQTEELAAQTEELRVANEELTVRGEELRATNEALRQSETRYRELVQNANSAIIRWNRDGTVTFFNEYAQAFFGYREDEAVGRHMNFLVPQHDSTGADLTGLIEDIVKHPDRYVNHVNENVCRDGWRVWMNWTNKPVFDEHGNVVEIMAVGTDVTERKHAEETLRESEERFHRLFEDDLTGDFISTAEGQILLCNPAFARIFGFSSAGEAVGTNILERYIDPTEREPLMERLRQQRQIERLGVWRKRLDGEPIYIVENLIGHFNERGELYEIKGYLFDDTERKHAEEALRMSEEKFRNLHAMSPIGIVLNRLDNGQFLESNRALWDMTGYTEEEFRSLTYWDITPIEYKDTEAKQLELLDTVGRYGPYEKEYIRKDGSRFPVLLSGVRIADPSGMDLIYSVIQDITELKATEQTLREWNATLETKISQRTAELQYRARQLQKLALELSEAEDRERRRIAEILHDDLQQILAAAKFHVNLLRSRAKYDPSMQTTAAQIDHMLKDAIDKSRALSHELSPAVLQHGDFSDTLTWLSGQIQTKHGLLVHVDAFSEVQVQSDALRAFLYRTAQELLFNVVKHARVNEARIRIRRWGRCVCLSVSDHGRGFDPQELRAAAGFGLFSIRERVELLGGRMKIKSAKGKGSTFHIVVPDGELVTKDVAKQGLDIAAAEAERARGEGERRLRVLLADDHEIVRQGLMSLLSEEHTIQVVGEAANGREAVDLADRLRPDVVIMDVAMPLIDGDEATRQIKLHLPETRIIALSMYEEHRNVEKMLQAGAEAYVLKTAPSEDLLAAIRGRSPSSIS